MFLTRSEYDRGVNTFSPEGRLFQVEYAIEAIKLGSTAIGIQTNEGLVLAVEKRVTSPLIEPSSIEKILEVDSHIGCAMSGLIADSRTLIDKARVEAQNHWFTFNEKMSVESVTQAVSNIALQFGDDDADPGVMSRPFGVALLFAGIDDKGPQFYELNDSARKTSETERNVTEDMATICTPGPTIHRIQIPAVSNITTSESDMASVSTAELENSRSLILLYASKRHSYKPSAFRASNLFSALDYNSHIDGDVIVNTDGTIRYHVDPSGTFIQYDAKAIGSGSEGAQQSLQEVYHKSITLKEACKAALTILKQVMEEKLNSTNVEMATVTPEKMFHVCTKEELEEVIKDI